jgi:hypothetical protein
LDYHLLLAEDLGYIRPASSAKLRSEAVDVKRMLAGLIQRPRQVPAAIPPAGKRKADA